MFPDQGGMSHQPPPSGHLVIMGSSGPLHIFIKVHLVYHAVDIQPRGIKNGNEFVVMRVCLGESMLQNANAHFPLKVNFLKRLTAASANRDPIGSGYSIENIN